LRHCFVKLWGRPLQRASLQLLLRLLEPPRNRGIGVGNSPVGATASALVGAAASCAGMLWPALRLVQALLLLLLLLLLLVLLVLLLRLLMLLPLLLLMLRLRRLLLPRLLLLLLLLLP